MKKLCPGAELQEGCRARQSKRPLLEGITAKIKTECGSRKSGREKDSSVRWKSRNMRGPQIRICFGVGGGYSGTAAGIERESYNF